MPRFALLEHVGAPDDPAGRHVDLLLEAGSSCRTWRLIDTPAAGGDAVAGLEVAPHRLDWLDCEAADVSGGRGRVRRIDAGQFRVLSLDAAELATAGTITVDIAGAAWAGRLRLERVGDGWAVGMMVPSPETAP